MKHSLLFAFVLVLSFCSASHAQSNPPWVETTGPSNIKCFAASGDTIFAGSAAGLYLSPDNGTTWISDGLNSLAVFSLAAFDGKVFAGTSGSGLFISTNSGVSWKPDTNGLNGATEISSLVTCAPNMVAATSNGLCVSTDGGATWTQEQSLPRASGLATDGTNVYATAIANSDFYASTDRGVNWTVVSTTVPTFIYSLAVLDGDIFAALGSGGGIIRTTNGGLNWEPVNNGAFDSLLTPEFNCHFLLAYGQNLFMASNDGIYLSTDTGLFWALETDTLESQPGTGTFFVNSLLVWNEQLWAAAGTLEGVIPGADDSIWVCPLSGLIGSSSVTTAQPSTSFSTFPNPFTQSTTINFSTDKSGLAEVSVVNVLGTPVARIFTGPLEPGTYMFTWDASGLAAGMYECIVSMNGKMQEVPIMIAR